MSKHAGHATHGRVAGSMSRPAHAVWCATLLVATWLLSLPAAATMPPNPDRLLRAKSCGAALESIRRAAQGSPLISAEENRAILLAAVAQAERLCLQQNEKKPQE